MVEIVRDTCQLLGLLINEQTSILTPVQRIEFIGAVIDSIQARVLLHEARFLVISELIA